MTRAVYYNLSVTDFWKTNNKLTLFSSFAILGSSDLKPKPTFTLLGQYQINDNINTTTIASVRYVMPAPEMIYLPETGKALQGGEDDYLIAGDNNLESGRLVSIENYLTIQEDNYYLKAGGGYSQFKSLPDWIADFNQLQYGSYQAVGLDRSFIFFSSEGMLSLPYNFHLSAAHTYRQVYQNKINYTYGAEHNLTGFSGTSFMIPKVDILLDASAGLKYRSVTNKYFASGGDNSVLMFEVFLTFNLKAFHFFWNYNNVLSKEYYVNGILQPGRSIWWGFRWRFMN